MYQSHVAIITTATLIQPRHYARPVVTSDHRALTVHNAVWPALTVPACFIWTFIIYTPVNTVVPSSDSDFMTMFLCAVFQSL